MWHLVQSYFPFSGRTWAQWNAKNGNHEVTRKQQTKLQLLRLRLIYQRLVWCTTVSGKDVIISTRILVNWSFMSWKAGDISSKWVRECFYLCLLIPVVELEKNRKSLHFTEKNARRIRPWFYSLSCLDAGSLERELFKADRATAVKKSYYCILHLLLYHPRILFLHICWSTLYPGSRVPNWYKLRLRYCRRLIFYVWFNRKRHMSLCLEELRKTQKRNEVRFPKVAQKREKRLS